ncbi:MAG: hypothetical protein GX564_11270 [Oligosphaeraceae bacterium]|nr:hypothetical protein [Oligosphaeraceae bacterium]
MMKRFLALTLLLFSLALSAAEFKCDFTPAGWKAEDWILIKSPRWEHFGNWTQAADHIANQVPEGASEAEMLGAKAAETYTSMLWGQKISAQKKVVLKSEMSFDHRMAPLLVIAPEYGNDAQGRPEYREHWEVVLYDEGLNVWHHSLKDGKPAWYKAGYLKAKYPAKEKLQLVVTITFPGGERHPIIEVECNGQSFGYSEIALPKEFYVGLTGCEGINRFYNFSVSY